jgi:hypothetical protein
MGTRNSLAEETGAHFVAPGTTILDDPAQSLRAREADATAHPDSSPGLAVLSVLASKIQNMSGPDGTTLPRRTGHPDPWRARSGETLRACPACRLGSRSYLPGQRHKLVDLESRGVSQRGAIQIHPLINGV